MPSAIGIRTRWVLAASDSAERPDAFGTDHDGHLLGDRDRTDVARVGRRRQRAHRRTPPRRVDAARRADPWCAPPGRRWPDPSRREAIGATAGSALVVVEDHPVPSECDRVADDRADVDRVVDGLDRDQPCRLLRDAASAVVRAGPGEEGDDSLRGAQLGDHRPHAITTRVDRHVVGQPAGRQRRLGDVDERDDGGASGIEGAFDDEIAFGHEQPVAIVAAPLPAIGQATLVATEAGQAADRRRRRPGSRQSARQ